MRTNPVLDSFRYMLTVQSWTTLAFDVLLLAGIILAILVYRLYAEQRSIYHVWIWLARTVMGAMWWQQVIWKVPPNYGGLRFWTSEMAKFGVHRPSAGVCVECGAGSLQFLRTSGVRGRSLNQFDAAARGLVPSRLIARCCHGHQSVAGSLSFSWRMAVAVRVSDCRHGPVSPGTAGAESRP